jgi:hypothetical protein
VSSPASTRFLLLTRKAALASASLDDARWATFCPATSRWTLVPLLTLTQTNRWSITPAQSSSLSGKRRVLAVLEHPTMLLGSVGAPCTLLAATTTLHFLHVVPLSMRGDGFPESGRPLRPLFRAMGAWKAWSGRRTLRASRGIVIQTCSAHSVVNSRAGSSRHSSSRSERSRLGKHLLCTRARNALDLAPSLTASL